MKIQRKLKKRIIKVFGRGTYKGIIGGYLMLDSKNGEGVIVKYTGKPLEVFYNEGQYHLHIRFPKIY